MIALEEGSCNGCDVKALCCRWWPCTFIASYADKLYGCSTYYLFGGKERVCVKCLCSCWFPTYICESIRITIFDWDILLWRYFALHFYHIWNKLSFRLRLQLYFMCDKRKTVLLFQQTKTVFRKCMRLSLFVKTQQQRAEPSFFSQLEPKSAAGGFVCATWPQIFHVP